jgi:hypothetical protein
MLTVLLLVLPAVPADSALIEFAVGAYGGASLPLEDDAEAGTVLGAKVRVLTPVPILGFEAWYSRFGYEDPGDVAESGDLSLALDGDGFDLYGADVLIGGVRGVPGFKWYGIVGVSAPEFEELVDEVTEDTDSKRKLGGQLGVGLEIVPPALSLGIEGRATLMFLDLSGDADDKMAVLSVGANYYF